MTQVFSFELLEKKHNIIQSADQDSLKRIKQEWRTI